MRDDTDPAASLDSFCHPRADPGRLSAATRDRSARPRVAALTLAVASADDTVDLIAGNGTSKAAVIAVFSVVPEQEVMVRWHREGAQVISGLRIVLPP